MKKLYLFVFLQSFFLISTAQSQSDSNYSFGIKLFALEELPKTLNEIRTGDYYYNTSFNGLIFKVNDNQISYRFLVNKIKNNNYSFKNECVNCEIVNGKYSELNVKIGFERNITYSRFQPYYGMDLGYKGVDFTGQSRDANTSAFMYHANVEKYGVTISPFIGVKFNILKSLTISAESGIDFFYSNDKEVKSGTNNAFISSESFKRWNFINKPLGLLSLQYNFGSDQ